MTLKRIANWKPALDDYFAEAETTKGVYGQHDCGIFAARAVNAMTDVDLGLRFYNNYTSLEESIPILKEFGVDTPLEYFKLFIPVGELAYAHTGDLAAFDTPEGETMGVIYGSRIFAPAPGLLGLGSVNLFRAKTILKVGQV